MKKLYFALLACAVIFGAIIAVEVLGSRTYYVLEPAVIRKIVPSPVWKFVGYEKMTLVRFDDGYDTEIAGSRGLPGERILVKRDRGLATPFGILGDN